MAAMQVINDNSVQLLLRAVGKVINISIDVNPLSVMNNLYLTVSFPTG